MPAKIDSKVSRGSAPDSGYGVAIDVGTSSIWARLVRLADGAVAGTSVLPNPQQQHGADIATRLGLAAGNPAARKELNRDVIEALNDSLGRLCDGAGIGARDLKVIVAVGNSAMYAFILNLDPAPLCGTPFNIKRAEDYLGPATALGLAAPEATLFIPRPVFGFVGADALADIFLMNMAASEKPALAVDVGTNCEIALGCKGRIFVASAPAGPAYEDSHMSFGLSATKGAIFKARLDGEVFRYEVVGGGEPKGICGSGLIDIIAEMRRNEWIDGSGRLLREGPVTVAGGDRLITVSQHDVRSFQLVKASIHAAISVLQTKLDAGELSRMLITGTFGSYINLDNARLLKMFPDAASVEVTPDAACQGAVLLLSEENRRRLTDLRASIRHVALPLNKTFQQEFVRLMEL